MGKRLAVIFNHENYKPGINLPRRNGTDKDCIKIKTAFTELGFEVVQHNDLRVRFKYWFSTIVFNSFKFFRTFKAHMYTKLVFHTA